MGSSAATAAVEDFLIFFRHAMNSVGEDLDARMKPFAGDGARLATKHISAGTWPIWTNGHALDAS